MTDRPTIIVGGSRPHSAPPPHLRGTGVFFDGDLARKQPVTIRYDDSRAVLTIDAEGGSIQWPYDEIRALKDQAGDDLMVLRLASDPTARLVLARDEDHILIRARAKALHRSASHVAKGRIIAWAGAAVACVALIIFVLVPVMADQLANYLPPRGEKALGDATFEQIRSALDETGFAALPICETPEGRAALQKIENRLTSEVDLATPLTVHVLDHPMVNAFALPGGYVVFFNGLIDSAERPEEVAAVFAHEIGHVQARDPTRIALRSAGSIGVLGLLFGDFAGGALVLFLTEQIIRADYTQDAEAAADAFAHAVLLSADLPPSAIGTFFERLASVSGEDAGILEHFMSHPAMGDRIEAARNAEPAGAVFRPLLTEAEWQALRSICN